MKMTSIPTCITCTHHYYTNSSGEVFNDICRMMGGGDTFEYDDDYQYLPSMENDRLHISEWVTVPHNYGCIHHTPLKDSNENLLHK